MLDGLLELFGNRVLAFDTAAARNYAELAVKARPAGKGLPTPDGYIATIAASRGVAPFQAAGLKVITPWEVRH